MTALSIPDENRIGGDWHFVAALCYPNAHIQSAGTLGSLTNTNQLFGNMLIIDKADILRRRGIDLVEEKVFCALHPRALADLLYHSLSRKTFPAHVTLDGGIFEEEIEFEMLDRLMKLMTSHLDVAQQVNLSRWKNEHFYPLRDGVSA